MTAREPPPRRAPGRGREFGHHCPPTSERRTRLPGPEEAFSRPTPQHLPKPMVRNPAEGRPQSPRRRSSGGFPPPEQGLPGDGQIVECWGPARRRSPSLSLSSFQSAESYTCSLFMGPLGSSCSPEVRGPSSQSKIKTFNPGLHLSETLERPASKESQRSGTRVGQTEQGLLWMRAHTQQQWDAWTGRGSHSRA